MIGKPNEFKTFTALSEKRFNNFLQQRKDVTVIDIKFSVAIDSSDVMYQTFLIIYKEGEPS